MKVIELALEEYNAIMESRKILNEEVIFQGKQLTDLLKAISKKLLSNKNIIKSVKISDWHGTSLDIKLKNNWNDDTVKFIVDTIKEQCKLFEKKYNCHYTWGEKVATDDSCLIVFDCEIE